MSDVCTFIDAFCCCLECFMIADLLMSFVVGLLELLLCSKSFFSFVFGEILSSPSPAALVVEI